MAEKTPIKNPYQVNIMERRHKKALGDEEEEALFYAIKENKVDTVRYLVKQNLNVNHLFFGGAGPKSFWTGLHLCCESGSYECCKVLLEAGADPNIADRNGQAPLMYAASTGWENLTELLLSSGADIRMNDISGRNVVHLAASCDCARIMQILLKYEVDINSQDTMGRTPLWLAASSQVGVATLLEIINNTREDAINLCDSRMRRNALQAAIMLTTQDLYKKVEVLVNNGCNIYNIDHRVNTPVMNIMQRWYESDKKGQLTADIKNDLIACYRLLVRSGYCVNFHTAGTRSFDHDGSVLHLVAKLGLHGMIDMLVEDGIHINQINGKGLTSLHIAAHHNHVEVVKLLLQYGSNINDVSYFTFHNFGNKIIFGSTFRLALESKALDTALFIMDAGYDLHLESYLLDEIDVPDILKRNKNVFEYLKYLKLQRDMNIPDKLSVMCIQLLRYKLCSRLRKSVGSLPLPTYLKDMICFKHLLGD